MDCNNKINHEEKVLIEEIKPAINKLCLCELSKSVGQSVCQLAENSVKCKIFNIHNSLAVGFRVDLKILLG